MNYLKTSGKPNKILILIGIGKEIVKTFLSVFLKKKLGKINSYTYRGANLSGRSDGTSGYLLKKPVFEKGNADWISRKTAVTEQYIITKHFSIKVSPKEASFKKETDRCLSNLTRQGN